MHGTIIERFEYASDLAFSENVEIHAILDLWLILWKNAFLSGTVGNFIDDIDSRNFRKGKEKDSYYNELNWEEINRFTRNFCENNSSDTILTQYFGKTGLAKIVKISEKGSLANPLVIKDRSLFLKLIMIIKRRFKNLFRVR